MDFYLKRFSLFKPFIKEKTFENLEFIIVIPCFNEEIENISKLCKSLEKCDIPGGSVEIIFIINEPKNIKEEISLKNEKVYKFLKEWKKKKDQPEIKWYIIYVKNLNPKKFGVGLARKIGFDEAIYRFNSLRKENGIIASLDADCVVKENYVEVIMKKFKEKNIDFAHLYFEHPYENIREEKLKKAIIYYELFLRYYKNSLQWTGYPFVSYTIGSCMVFNAKTYAKFGGIKAKRKAGEDFYFVQKILPFVNYTEIQETCVYPGIRISERVPFGTGKALKDFIENKNPFYITVPFEPFEDIKEFMNTLREVPDNTMYFLKRLPLPLRKFLIKEKIENKIKEIKHKTKKRESFYKKFFMWFNLLKIWKYIRFTLKEKYYEERKIEDSVISLLKNLNIKEIEDKNAETLLELLRQYDKKK